MRYQLNETAAARRNQLVRMISRDLLGPIVGKMPKSSIESLEKLSYLPNIERHIVEIIPMAPAEVVRHDVGAGYPPFIRTEAVFGRRNLYLLRDAVVSPQSGMAWIGNRIIDESVGSLRRIMDWGDLLHEPLMPVQELPLEEPVVVCHPAAGYYHWLLEVLPNLLFAVSRFPQVRIVVPENCPEYLRNGLTTVFGSDLSGRLVSCATPVRVQKLVMPQYHTAPEFTSPGVVRLLQSEVKEKVVGQDSPGTGRSTPGERIYISRQKSRRRRLAGEVQLEGMLQERGFRIVHCEELSFEEQIRLFNEAETVVATHGAGLSNIVWSRPPCRVIEIFPQNYILDCFAWLSFSLGFDYRFVICSTGHKIDDEAMMSVLDLL